MPKLRLADSVPAIDRLERPLFETIQDQSANIVGVRINQGPLNNFGKRSICEFAFRRDTFSLRPRRQASQLIAGLLLIGLGKNLAQIGKTELLNHGHIPSDEDYYHFGPEGKYLNEVTVKKINNGNNQRKKDVFGSRKNSIYLFLSDRLRQASTTRNSAINMVPASAQPQRPARHLFSGT